MSKDIKEIVKGIDEKLDVIFESALAKYEGLTGEEDEKDEDAGKEEGDDSTEDNDLGHDDSKEGAEPEHTETDDGQGEEEHGETPEEEADEHGKELPATTQKHFHKHIHSHEDKGTQEEGCVAESFGEFVKASSYEGKSPKAGNPKNPVNPKVAVSGWAKGKDGKGEAKPAGFDANDKGKEAVKKGAVNAGQVGPKADRGGAKVGSETFKESVSSWAKKDGVYPSKAVNAGGHPTVAKGSVKVGGQGSADGKVTGNAKGGELTTKGKAPSNAEQKGKGEVAGFEAEKPSAKTPFEKFQDSKAKKDGEAKAPKTAKLPFSVKAQTGKV